MSAKRRINYLADFMTCCVRFGKCEEVGGASSSYFPRSIDKPSGDVLMYCKSEKVVDMMRGL